MKYLVAGLVGLFACFAVAGSSGWVTHAGNETRLRAVLSATDLDPGAIGQSDFIQRPDRVRFSTEVSNVEEIGTLTVKVIQNATVVTEMRGLLLFDSGEDPAPQGEVAVAEALWSRGTNLSLKLENLDVGRFPGNESCEAEGKVGPVAGTLTMLGSVAKLNLETNVPDLVPGTGAEIRIRCEFDAQGQRQRHETRWSGNLVPVAATTGIILKEFFEIVDPLGGLGPGMGDLNRDSRLGHIVPIMVAGDTVEVWNAEGELILSGKLERN